MKSVPHKLVKVIFPKTQENWYKRFTATVDKYKHKENELLLKFDPMEKKTKSLLV